MTRRILSGLAPVLLALPLSLLSACGAPGGLDLCYLGCDYTKKCVDSTDAAYTNCRNDCNSSKGAYSDDDNRLASKCQNPGDVRSRQVACYNKACSEVLKVVACLATTETDYCIKK